MPDKGKRAANDPVTEEKSRGVFNVAAILLFLAFFIFLCQLVNFGSFHADAHGPDSLPVSIRASSQADYRRDPNAPSVPPISENILKQIITDVPATGSPQDRIATLQVILTLSVPSTTPHSTTPTAGLPPGVTPVATHTGQPTVQPTIVTPVKSPVPEPTGASNSTQAPRSTKAPRATKEPKSTKPPKATKEPKATKALQPVNPSGAGDNVGSPSEEGMSIAGYLPGLACDILNGLGITFCQPEDWNGTGYR